MLYVINQSGVLDLQDVAAAACVLLMTQHHMCLRRCCPSAAAETAAAHNFCTQLLHAPVSHGYAQLCADACSSSDAWHAVHRDAVLLQVLHLLAAPAKDIGVPAF
jgi:hypothetical protein